MISLELVWELEYDFLAGKFLVDVAESFQFVFNISLHGFVEVDLEKFIRFRIYQHLKTTKRDKRHTLRSLVASSLTRVLFPTISAGKHKSSKMALWTEVKVLLNGLFCFWFLVLRVGFGKILL